MKMMFVLICLVSIKKHQNSTKCFVGKQNFALMRMSEHNTDVLNIGLLLYNYYSTLDLLKSSGPWPAEIPKLGVHPDPPFS
jgi:hypothetical protein